MSHLNEDFLAELFKLCFRKRDIVDACRQHLKYHYIPDEAYKHLWKAIRTHYVTHSELPSFGVIAQQFSSGSKQDKATLEALAKIKEIPIPKEEDILDGLELYIKDSMSVEFYDKFPDLYNKGDREGARDLLRDVTEKLNKFSIKKNTTYFEKIFKGFEKRQIRKKSQKQIYGNEKKKAFFYIDDLDYACGGIDEGDTALFLALSGVGKTKLLRHIGVRNARAGHKVLHIQAEGTKEECEDGYDATWTAQNLNDIQFGDIDETDLKDLLKISKEIIAQGGDIYVEAFEQFGTASILDLRNLLIEFEKIHGEPPFITLVDYFELLDPGDGKTYGVGQERQRREALSKGYKNLSVEQRTRIITATQAGVNNISISDLADPDFVMTRFDISEFKGALQPFSVFCTLNQTPDEYNDGIMRIFTDKIRKRKGNQIITICQAYEYDKFYDRKRTMREIHEKEI